MFIARAIGPGAYISLKARAGAQEYWKQGLRWRARESEKERGGESESEKDRERYSARER